MRFQHMEPDDNRRDDSLSVAPQFVLLLHAAQPLPDIVGQPDADDSSVFSAFAGSAQPVAYRAVVCGDPLLEPPMPVLHRV